MSEPTFLRISVTSTDSLRSKRPLDNNDSLDTRTINLLLTLYTGLPPQVSCLSERHSRVPVSALDDPRVTVPTMDMALYTFGVTSPKHNLKCLLRYSRFGGKA